MPIAISHSYFLVRFDRCIPNPCHPYRKSKSKAPTLPLWPSQPSLLPKPTFPLAKANPVPLGRPNLPFVIPTGAKRSGGICGFALGRNETRKCTEPFSIHTFSLGPTDEYRTSFHPYRKPQIETPSLPLVIPTGAKGSEVPLSDATKLMNAVTVSHSHFTIAWEEKATICIRDMEGRILRSANEKRLIAFVSD